MTTDLPADSSCRSPTCRPIWVQSGVPGPTANINRSKIVLGISLLPSASPQQQSRRTGKKQKDASAAGRRSENRKKRNGRKPRSRNGKPNLSLSLSETGTKRLAYENSPK